ncbi:MAG: Rossmann-like domain-containing protein [Promethearchaeota archaeon]
MPISSDYVKIIEKISDRISIPKVKDIVIPTKKSNQNISNFAAVALEDNTIGIIFINLTNNVKQKFFNLNPKQYRGMQALNLAKKFESKDLFNKSLGLGGINAISQFLFKKCEFSFEYASDSLGLLEIDKDDIVGMVGFFPPLVNHIERIGNKLIIIEKKGELLKEGLNWRVTLDPSELKPCNKILITSTTLLNETIDEILQHCKDAEKISMIGPTAGFLPDPLFKRRINIIGGTRVVDPRLLLHSIENNIKWAGSAKKYIIKKNLYVGYKNLLNEILK